MENGWRGRIYQLTGQTPTSAFTCETPFGIRTIEFTADNGFLLNGKHVPINGVCDHSDLGPLGTVVNTRALERQIEILKTFGCNAIRTSHNAPAPELLDLCDQMGMLVMDESFDCWQGRKRRNDYSLLFNDWHDRNHPSIILWSIGNEIKEQRSPEKFWIPAELTRIAHEEEPFQAREHDAFNGLALGIIRATQPGDITLKAYADGLKGATTLRGEDFEPFPQLQ